VIHGGVGPDLDPRFTLVCLDAAVSPLSIDVAIDTGFVGFVALPTDLILQLNLPLITNIRVELADGSEIIRQCFEARVDWNGTVRTVRAFDLGPDPLAGINFLWGHRLTIDIKVGGDVTVEPLP
jgi:clan AA aspartic protease